MIFSKFLFVTSTATAGLAMVSVNALKASTIGAGGEGSGSGTGGEGGSGDEVVLGQQVVQGGQDRSQLMEELEAVRALLDKIQEQILQVS